MVEALKAAGRLRGLGGACDDVIRSLSRTLYEADPEQWKENLNRSTMPLGDKEARQKSWRVTVTDPRGGRGLDYRIGLGSGVIGERGSAPKKGRHSTTCVSTRLTCAVAARWFDDPHLQVVPRSRTSRSTSHFS